MKQYNLTRLTLVSLIGILLACNSNPRPVNVLKSPAGSSTELPYLTKDNTGRLFLSWVKAPNNNGKVSFKYSRLINGNWSPPETIANGNDWFVNWADFPSVTGFDGKLMAAHWLHKTPGHTYSYEVKMRLSDIKNKKDTVITPHFDQTATEHGFVSMDPIDGDKVLAVWLDGRQTANRAEDEYGDLSKAMTIRSAVIGRDGSVTNRQMIDSTVCDCCQTSLAITGDRAIVAYRDRTEDEIRDIYVSRYEQGQWTEPNIVHKDEWKIGGCPVNGPVIRASGDTVVVAWFTGANEQYQVKAAYSFDGGSTFRKPLRIDEGNPIGRVDAAFISEGSVAISWMEKTDEKAALKYRIVDIETDVAQSPVKVAAMSADRKSGFPQLEFHNGALIFAWTALGEETSVQTTTVSLY